MSSPIKNLTSPVQNSRTDGWLSRERSLALVLVLATGVVGYLFYRLIIPFLPSLAWALALAVMAHPLHRRIKRSITNTNIAAGTAVFIVALLIVAPAVFVTQHLANEASHVTVVVQDVLESGRWHKFFDEHPGLSLVESWIERRMGLPPRADADEAPDGVEESTLVAPDSDSSTNSDEAPAPAPVDQATDMLSRNLSALITGTGWLVMQLLVTFMNLFFFFRDRHTVLGATRSLLPLTHDETDEVFKRVDDTIHATIYGSVVVAFVQGSMGGLMFWWLGIPSPLLWGAIMSMLAVVPMLGTFVIWGPTAVFLALSGEWTKAIMLVTWGALAIGTIDNFLYPFLVGKRLRLHTLVVFFAIVGGVTFFGASGLILGPLVLASADALLDIWRRRTAFGGTIEEAVEPSPEGLDALISPSSIK